jgi:hypothetical protein
MYLFPAECEDCHNQKAADIQLHYNIQKRIQTKISRKYEEIYAAEPFYSTDSKAAQLNDDRLNQLTNLIWHFDKNELDDPYYKPAICIMHADMGAYLQNSCQRDLIKKPKAD